MKKVVVKITWSRSKYLPMAILGHANAKAMTANAKFATPAVFSGEMEQAALDVEHAYAQRKNGATARDLLKKCATDLDEKLHAQAEYVNDIAKGDESIIHSAAFEATSNAHTKSPLPKQVLSAPILDSKMGGTVKATTGKVEGVNVYTFILVLDGPFNVTIKENGQLVIPEDAIVHIISGTIINASFTGLPGKLDALVAVVTKSPAGYSNISPVASIQTMS